MRLWAAIASSIVLLGGILICCYLTWHHEQEIYGHVDIELTNCPKSETVDCDVVNTSEYSEFFGLPIALLGIVTYLTLICLIWLAYGYYAGMMAYAFGIGLLTIVSSIFLFYISQVKIGYICLWCFRLYVINFSIPILVAITSKRTPVSLFLDALSDLKKWPKELRITTAIFVILLIASIGILKGYRSSVIAAAKLNANKTENVSQQKSEKGTGSKPSIATGSEKITVFALKAPLTQLVTSDKGPEEIPFNFNTRIGKGKPVAVIVWHPSNKYSVTTLKKMSQFFRNQVPEFNVYAMTGWKSDANIDILMAAFKKLELTPDIPLLVDKGYGVSKELQVYDIPDIVIIDGHGILISTKFKWLTQIALYSQQRRTTEQIIKMIARGASVPPIKAVQPYYPSTEYYGKCAPSFTLKDFQTGEHYKFTGKSENNKPTFLIFWSATCKHCKKELPAFIRYAREHPDKYNIVSVIHIKPDEKDKPSYRKITATYLKNIGFIWPVLDDADYKVGDLYKSISTPTTFAITKDGKIIEAWFYVHHDFDKAMNNMLWRLENDSGACDPSQPNPWINVN